MALSERITRSYKPWNLGRVLELSLAVLVGSFVRLFRPLSSDFPLNDGGLFYSMVKDLVDSHYVLPAITSYNSAGIPYAYPPLPLYVAAFLSDIMGFRLLDIVRLLPPIVSILTIPAFYLLSRTLLRSRAQSVFAVFAFALLPHSFVWLIMGGGLTRAPGFLFALLTLHQACLLYTSRLRRFVLPTALFLSLTILSHPEKAFFAVFSMGILCTVYGRNREGIRNSLAVGTAAVTLAAPWWVTVVNQHGLSPLLSALQTGDQSWTSLSVLFIFTITDEPLLGLLACLGLLGLFVCIADRKLALPLWLLAAFMLEPRSALRFATVPLAMMVGIGLDRVILPAVRVSQTAQSYRGPRQLPAQRDSHVERGQHFAAALPKLVLVYLLFYALFSAIYLQMLPGIPLFPLSRQEREAMQWISASLPRSSKVLLVSSTAWWKDNSAEWFPVLGQCVSVATVQGYEWLPDRQFQERKELYAKLQDCVTQGVNCLENWTDEANVTITHVYLPKPTGSTPGAAESSDDLSSLRNSLKASSQYAVVYDGPGQPSLPANHLNIADRARKHMAISRGLQQQARRPVPWTAPLRNERQPRDGRMLQDSTPAVLRVGLGWRPTQCPVPNWHR